MASLRLTFPEKDQPTVIALTGARLTIGRLPFNTIQIIDRTVSGFHAELIAENGHYRLHDRGSSNGTFVNGQKVGDYHLNEACSITFGTVEAQFSPEALPAEEEAETFPTRSEVNAVRQENADLKSTIAALREEAEALRSVRPIEGGDAALAVSKEEFNKVVAERETLKEARLKQEEELARIKADLSVLKRDRVNLQLAYDGVQRELSELRAKAGVVEELTLAPKAAAVALAAQAPKAEQEIRVEVPAPVPPPAAEAPAAPVAPAPAPEPTPVAKEAPAEPTIPVAPQPPLAPFAPKTPPPAPTSLPKAPSLPGAAPKPPTLPSAAPRVPSAPAMPAVPAKPFAPLPRNPAAPGVAATSPTKPAGSPPAPAKAPPGLGGGMRPLAPKPLSPVEGLKTQTMPAAIPAPRVVPRPVPSSVDQPTVKITLPPPGAGPKGTQKLR